MTKQPDDDFARSWLKYQDHQTDGDEWAVFELQDLILDDKGRAVRAVAWLIEVAESEWHLTMIGVGPLEDLLNLYGPSIIADLEPIVFDKDKLMRTLRGVVPGNPEVESALNEIIKRDHT